jgi:hypothetical protein
MIKNSVILISKQHPLNEIVLFDLLSDSNMNIWMSG